MQLHQPGMHWTVFKVQGGCLQNISPKLLPAIRFRENGVSEGTGAIAAFFRVANLENQFHAPRIPKFEEPHLLTSRAADLSFLLRQSKVCNFHKNGRHLHHNYSSIKAPAYRYPFSDHFSSFGFDTILFAPDRKEQPQSFRWTALDIS